MGREVTARVDRLVCIMMHARPHDHVVGTHMHATRHVPCSPFQAAVHALPVHA